MNPKLLLTFLIASSLLLLTSCAPFRVARFSVNTTHSLMLGSVGRITSRGPGAEDENVCTAQSLGAHHFLTAAHCAGHGPGQLLAELKVDDLPARVTRYDDQLDLALLDVNESKPPVQFRQLPPKVMETVYAMGFGEGFSYPLVTEHSVLALHFAIEEGVYPGTIYLHPFIGGMSGGPVYDKSGDVVGIVQRANKSAGYGVDVTAIQHFIHVVGGL